MSDKEVLITNNATGGKKCAKPVQMSLLPWEQMWKVAELYYAGAKKYSRYNYKLGYDWSLSFDAMMRHATQFWSGENNDLETGCPHLAAVVFHALTLMDFEDNYPELDDRYKKEQ